MVKNCLAASFLLKRYLGSHFLHFNILWVLLCFLYWKTLQKSLKPNSNFPLFAHCWKRILDLHLNPIVYFCADHSRKILPGTQPDFLIWMAKSYIRTSLNYSFKYLFSSIVLLFLFGNSICRNFCAFYINHFLFDPSELFYFPQYILFAFFSFLSSVSLTMPTTQFIFLQASSDFIFICINFFSSTKIETFLQRLLKVHDPTLLCYPTMSSNFLNFCLVVILPQSNSFLTF